MQGALCIIRHAEWQPQSLFWHLPYNLSSNVFAQLDSTIFAERFFSPCLQQWWEKRLLSAVSLKTTLLVFDAELRATLQPNWENAGNCLNILLFLTCLSLNLGCFGYLCCKLGFDTLKKYVGYFSWKAMLLSNLMLIKKRDIAKVGGIVNLSHWELAWFCSQNSAWSWLMWRSACGILSLAGDLVLSICCLLSSLKRLPRLCKNRNCRIGSGCVFASFVCEEQDIQQPSSKLGFVPF